jgi:Concanavalin A-like lectin/glucanases superfamily
MHPALQRSALLIVLARTRVALLCVVFLALTTTARAQNGYSTLVLSPSYAAYRYLPLNQVDASATSPDVGPFASPATSARVIGAPPVVPGPLFNLPSGGSALAIDGVAQHLELDIPDFAGQFSGAAGVSWVIWYRAFDTARGAIFATQDQPDRNGFQLLLGANQSWNLPSEAQLTGVVTFPSGDHRAASITSDFADRDWHLLAVTYRAGEMRVFVDGLPVRPAFNNRGGTPRLDAFARSLIIGGVPTGTATAPTIAARKRLDVAHLSLHSLALDDAQILALWYAGNGYTGQAVFNAPALRPWFLDAQSRRVDVALVGDSNIGFGSTTGPSGHNVGMLQGLRRVLPIFGSALLTGAPQGGWASQLNGIAPPSFRLSGPEQPLPEFIRDAWPPHEQSFVSRPLYVAPGQEVLADAGAISLLNPISIDFPLAFSQRFQWQMRIARFGQASSPAGTFRPGLRQGFFPFSPLVSTAVSTLAAADGFDILTLEAPAGPRPANVYSLQYADLFSDLASQGPISVLCSRLLNPDQRSGAALSTIWAAGGESARFGADKFVNQSTVAQLGALLSEIVRAQSPDAPRLLVHIIEGGNDANDRRFAYSVTGQLTDLRSDTLAGQKLNTLAIMTRTRDAWINQGYDPARLHFLLGPYHPTETVGPKLRTVYLRGWRELARDLPSWNITVMDGFALSSINEFNDNNWYDPGGQSHLTEPGYLNFGLRTWQRLAQEAGFATAVGACCAGATCTLRPFDSCSPGRFAGLGTTCNAPGNRSVPCCLGDFDQSGQAQVNDLFEFIGAWFSNDPRAAVPDAAGTPTIDDLFEFIHAWFAGC